jgi:protein TonB
LSGIKLPLSLSVAGHTACLALLVLLSSKEIPLPEPAAKGGFEVVFQPALPKVQAAPVPEPQLQADIPPTPVETSPPEPQADLVPPLSQAPLAAAEPALPVPEAAPIVAVEPTQPPKPPAKRTPKPPPRRLEAARASPDARPAAETPRAAPASPQTAAAATPVPARVPSPEASAGYRALLSAWLERHKRYPDAARQRGEEGRAVLRFAVERSGRVIDYAVAKSSGYPDLDASIEDMMRDAVLPPFPEGMTQPRIEVSVTIRFSLAR